MNPSLGISSFFQRRSTSNSVISEAPNNTRFSFRASLKKKPIPESSPCEEPRKSTPIEEPRKAIPIEERPARSRESLEKIYGRKPAPPPPFPTPPPPPVRVTEPKLLPPPQPPQQQQQQHVHISPPRPSSIRKEWVDLNPPQPGHRPNRFAVAHLKRSMDSVSSNSSA